MTSPTSNSWRAAGLEASPLAPDVSGFIALLQPRVMSLVVFTGLTGMAMAPGSLHPVLAFVAILCIAVGAGASGAINMWYDADIDAVMSRTQKRPIPAGKVSAEVALAFGCILSAGSVALMGLAVNWLAAGLLAFTILFYVGIYTMWLKRRTPQNIVIGGAAGAFPPMIGWAAVTGDIALGGVVLFLIIFFWTPPHFWALALFRRGDYASAGVPMLPVVKGEASTRRQIVGYTVLMLASSFAPLFFGVGGTAYLIGAAALGSVFLVTSLLVLRAKAGPSRWAGRPFGFPNPYLFVLFPLLPVGTPLHLGAG